MARTLFARLNQQFGPRVDSATRREFLKMSLAASAGLMLSRLPAFADEPVKANQRRVGIIGGGFSGLACAYELMSAGYDITVIEARDRVSGRVLSFKDVVPGKNVEGGGELIGSNHPHWAAYKEKFGLEFIDVTEGAEGSLSPLYLNGQMLSLTEAKALYDQMQAALNHMNDDARAVNEDEPWKTVNADALDRKSTAEWVDNLKLEPICKAGVWAQLEGNNGQALGKQSYLGNLTQIKGGGVEKYWTESETFRCKGGNQQLALKFAEKLGNRVLIGLPVVAVDVREDKAIITCKDGRTIEVDDVVLAVPPTVWDKIKFTPAIPDAIHPQMGFNLKYLSVVKSRFWEAKKLSPWAQTDQFLSMTWDGTDNQPGDGPFELTCFSGGPSALKAREIPIADRDRVYREMMEKLYPGFGEQFISSRFMSWPDEPWTMAGYSFPAPGQVTTVGPTINKGIGRLHFAGEHTCYKFVGYMEGALSSGARVAKTIATRDGVAKV